MIKELIVVEGKSDTVAVKRAVEADTIETGGSAVDRKVIAKIALAMERRGVIILTDPDHAGERIRKIVSSKVPGCKHAFIPEKDATRKGILAWRMPRLKRSAMRWSMSIPPLRALRP